MCNMLAARALRFYAVVLLRRAAMCRATPPYVRPPMLCVRSCNPVCTPGFKFLLKGMAKYIVMVFVPTKDEDITSIISLYRFFALPLQ